MGFGWGARAFHAGEGQRWNKINELKFILSEFGASVKQDELKYVWNLQGLGIWVFWNIENGKTLWGSFIRNVSKDWTFWTSPPPRSPPFHPHLPYSLSPPHLPLSQLSSVLPCVLRLYWDWRHSAFLSPPLSNRLQLFNPFITLSTLSPLSSLRFSPPPSSFSPPSSSLNADVTCGRTLHSTELIFVKKFDCELCENLKQLKLMKNFVGEV